jgi:Plasmid pRiA4b ORF-3-like protein.
MVYRLKVTLAGIKGFYRVYEMGGDTTLYAFHKQMRSDMEFPQDQLIMFKAMDVSGAVLARYGLFDLGFGTVDNITVEQTFEAGVATFQYFYDVPNRKSVIIAFESVSEGDGGAPSIVDTKGPAPIEFENGYVAFEDLPDSERHLPGQKPDWSLIPDDPSDLSDIPDDSADVDDDDDDDDEDDDEDGKIVFDGTEDLNI